MSRTTTTTTTAQFDEINQLIQKSSSVVFRPLLNMDHSEDAPATEEKVLNDSDNCIDIEQFKLSEPHKICLLGPPASIRKLNIDEPLVYMAKMSFLPYLYVRESPQQPLCVP